MDQGAASYRRFIDGDRDAFGEVIDLYRESLIFFIHRYVNDMDTAEDLAEDVFVAPMETAETHADLLSLEQKILDNEEKRQLAEAMDALKAEYRIALHLVYFEGLSYEETGKIMKKGRKQVENYVNRGKRALREILEERGHSRENKR